RLSGSAGRPFVDSRHGRVQCGQESCPYGTAASSPAQGRWDRHRAALPTASDTAPPKGLPSALTALLAGPMRLVARDEPAQVHEAAKQRLDLVDRSKVLLPRLWDGELLLERDLRQVLIEDEAVRHGFAIAAGHDYLPERLGDLDRSRHSALQTPLEALIRVL